MSNWIANFYSKYNWFWNSAIWLAMVIFDPTPQKFSNRLLCFSNLSQHVKTYADWPSFLEMKLIQKSWYLIGWAHSSIFKHSQLKFLQTIFYFSRIYVSMPKIKLTQIFSGDRAYLRIQQYHWLTAVWLITQEPEFCRIWDLSRYNLWSW